MKIFSAFTLSFLILFSLQLKAQYSSDEGYVSYTVDPSEKEIIMVWQDDTGDEINSLSRFISFVEGKGQVLEFAVNGGMYTANRSPLGLYVENGLELHSINTKNAKGNFYLKPNGIFYVNHDGTPGISKTEDFSPLASPKFATQSGPMLVVEGVMHPAFKQGSTSLYIRNGVGILPDGKVLFVISKEPVNFYDFASYFLSKGCKNALYLDGFVSRMYCPAENWEQLDGDFGVMIGVISR